ncbi:MAG: family 43 glycosylhydrolase [Galactobacter sp.]
MKPRTRRCGALIAALSLTAAGLPALAAPAGATPAAGPQPSQLSVPAAPAASETPEAYLFAYFTADSVAGEKISLAVSDGNNAQKWIGLNDSEPILESDKGTKGLRDPFIIRSPENDKFYMIATDLSIGRTGDWNGSQRQGSRYIEIWESTDLVDWGQQRHVELAPENARNLWAPEAYWDDEREEYVVFWASKLYGPEDPDHTQTSPAQTMMYATTKDFTTFSEPKVWQNTGVSRIDSTVLKDGDTYHRFTKDEAQSQNCGGPDIFAETSTDLTQVTTADNGWVMGEKCIGHNAGTGGVEGPTVFKANPGDVNGEGFYLFVDEHGGRKYLPLKADALDGDWEAVTNISLPNPAPRHGTVLPITESERQALLAAYPENGENPDPIEKGQLLHYDFSDLDSAGNGATIKDQSDQGNDATVKGTGATVSDGVLSLPGGASNSGAAHLEIPRGTFDWQDTLTINMWFKNQTPAGNYAAMFFGSEANPPADYWLLNPSNPDGRFKSVITNQRNASAPWGTESGISPTTASKGIPGPKTSGDFSLYTTVIEPGKLTGYLDGEKIGTVDTGRSVKDLGKNLVSYIGKSSYPDAYLKGQIRDVEVLAEAESDNEVKQRYLKGLDEDTLQSMLEEDAEALSLPETAIADLNLPTSGANGSSIVWASDNADRISHDGTVTRGNDDETVTLTATLTLGGVEHKKTFKVTVLSSDPSNDVDYAAENFSVGTTQAWEDLTLVDEFEGTKVTWASSDTDAIASDGKVTRGNKAHKVTLSATFSLNGASTKRDFEITVLAEDAGSVDAYTVEGNSKATDVLHLATAKGDDEAVPGNQGRPVLYPTQGTVRMGSPTLFRSPAGGFNLLAPEINNDGPTGNAYVYTSKDLVAYADESLVKLAPGQAPTNLGVSYDNATATYTVVFTDAKDGNRYSVTSTDLATFTQAKPTAAAKAAASGMERALPEKTKDVASVAVTASELERVSTKLGRVVNTKVNVDSPKPVQTGADVPTLPETADVEYNSGYSSTFPVEWDQEALKQVDTSKPGTYTVPGKVSAPKYSDPLVERRADPDVTLGDDGYYYMTGSYPMTYEDDPEGYDRVPLRRAKTIEGLKDAEEVAIWHENSTPDVNRYIWAPELEKIGDDWYILFTGGRNGVFDIRPYMLKYTGEEFAGEDTLNPDNWELIGPVKANPGDSNAFTSFSLDMTHFENAGRHYLSWAEKPGMSVLRMAEIDPMDPTQLINDSILLSEPTQAWERNDAQNQQVDEGAAVIKHDGKIYMSFSASTVDRNYAVGLLTADENSDLMDPGSWTKTGYPIMTSADVPGQLGTGHNSFTTDEYGNPVIVFHSRTENDSSNPGEATDEGLFDPRRHARAKTVHFDVDGAPVFNMTPEEELDPELADVAVQVVVTADDPDEEPGDGEDGDDNRDGSDDGNDAADGTDPDDDADSDSDDNGDHTAAGSDSGDNNGSAANGSGTDAGTNGSGTTSGSNPSDPQGTASNGGGQSPLASTGAQVGALAGLAVLLLAAGAVLTARRKRRS